MVVAAVAATCNDHPEYLADPSFARYLGLSLAKRFLGLVKSSAAGRAPAAGVAGERGQ